MIEYNTLRQNVIFCSLPSLCQSLFNFVGAVDGLYTYALLLNTLPDSTVVVLVCYIVAVPDYPHPKLPRIMVHNASIIVLSLLHEINFDFREK